MRYSTTDTYQLKREIITFARRLSEGLPRDWEKFTADMLFGILASSSCILSRFADVLKEDILKKNTVERLARKLLEDMPPELTHHYLSFARDIGEDTGPVFVDDTDITKPYGKAFEDMGTVRDGSSADKKLKNGYYVTEMTALSHRTRQPISLYSHIHSSHSKNYTSVNDITFRALKEVFPYFPKATYVFDRGYDMNKLYLFMYEHEKSFIVRVTSNRNLFCKNKWFKSTTLRDKYKGKFKCPVLYGGKKTECRVTCVNVKITASCKWLKLVLVYGLSDTPMMLLTNRPVRNREDALQVVRMYFMRWRIEEHFRFKKTTLGFEDMRVRKLKAMNHLSQFVSMAIGFLCAQADKRNTSRLRRAVTREANGQKQEHKISFLLYRMGLGIQRILARAQTGIRAWFRIGRPKYRQLSFPLLC